MKTSQPNDKGLPIKWDYKDVPPRLAETCCIREYALESASIQRLKMETCAAITESGQRGQWNCWPLLDEAMIQLREQLLKRGFYHTLILGHNEVMSVDPEVAWPPLWPSYWMNVREFEMRAEAKARGLPATEYCDEGMYHGVPIHRPDLYFEEGTGSGQWLLSRNRANLDEFEMVWQSGCTSEVFSINWKEHRDEAIIAAFQQWLKEKRPVDLPQPKAKNGKRPTDFLKALQWLGMLRVRARFSYQHPQFPKEISDRFDYTEFRRQCRKAKKEFRHLFPFLGEEQPDCIKRIEGVCK